MSRRRSRRRPGPPGRADGTGDAGARERVGTGGHEQVEEHPDGEWVVRSVTGAASTKPYRCPGCDQEIRPATPHVVAWPAEGYGGIDDRRHWHTACWRSRGRRGPKVARSRNAPRH